MFNQTYHSLRAQVIEVEDQQYGGENVWVGHRLLWYFIYFTQKKSINFPLHLYNVLFVLYIKEQEKDHHFIIACSLYREKMEHWTQSCPRDHNDESYKQT